MTVDKIELENLRRWASAKRISNGLYNEYWGGYVRAIDDVLLLIEK